MSGINHYERKQRREMRRRFHEEKDVPRRLRKQNKETVIDQEDEYEYGDEQPHDFRDY